MTWTGAWLAILLARLAAGAQPTSGARDIGTERQLFVDRVLIGEMRGLALKLHAPVLREVAFRYDRPWEGETSWHPIVIKDGERYRMWYRTGSSNNDNESWTAHAESRDGIRWEKSSLGLVDFKGSKENNLVWPLAGMSGRNMTVIKDPRPGIPEEERYKAIVHTTAIYGLVSPDGLRWRQVQPDPLIPALKEEAHADGPHTLCWDPWESRYVIYRRGWWGQNRTVRRSVSTDFRRWSPPEFVDIGFGTAPREQFYTSAAQPYTRARGVYLMFPMRYIEERRFISDWAFAGLSDIALLTSRDGIRWDRTFREAFLRPGLDRDNWHERSMSFGSGIVETAPGELSMYLTERFRTPNAQVRRVTVRADGFVSVNAPELGGELITVPLVFSGRVLRLNYSTSATGSVRVEVLNAVGRPIQGYSLEQSQETFGDELDRGVAWGTVKEVGALAGQVVRLRFVMRDADLYSFRFAAE
jgi:hypothetical protein